jgi:hypothetical protein
MKPVELIGCPEPGCHAPAEILERFVLPSTDGPVWHLKTSCLQGHVRTPLADDSRRLPSTPGAPVRAQHPHPRKDTGMTWRIDRFEPPERNVTA